MPLVVGIVSKYGKPQETVVPLYTPPKGILKRHACCVAELWQLGQLRKLAAGGGGGQYVLNVLHAECDVLLNLSTLGAHTVPTPYHPPTSKS